MRRCLVSLLVAMSLAGTALASEQTPDDRYVRALRERGREPVAFVAEALDRHDLIIFDDAVHSAVEPFEFYERLLRDPRIRARVRLVFVETMSIAAQPSIDAYLASPTGDRMLLAKAFQDDYAGFGWRYATNLHLLEAVWAINRDLPAPERIRVVGVDQPIYWDGLHTRRDYEIFQDSLVARDYFLYATIRDHLDGFGSGKKALFLTNTRHAYMRLRGHDGRVHRNCAAFFEQYDPGKAFSVRLHNVTLSVAAAASPSGPRTTQGLEQYDYTWVRMAGGAWDRAFEALGNTPVGIELAGTPFGAEKYVGNSMLSARADQTMADAYDALIFLAPLESLRLSGKTGFYVTPEFRTELRRRLQVLEGERLPAFLAAQGVKTVDEFIDQLAIDTAPTRSTLLAR